MSEESKTILSVGPGPFVAFLIVTLAAYVNLLVDIVRWLV